MDLFNRKLKFELYYSEGFIETIIDLHMQFSGEMKRGPKPNTGQIEIYNCNDNFIAAAEALDKTDAGVLYAAYNDSAYSKVFSGNITASMTSPEGSSTKTIIELKDGYKGISRSMFSKVYQEGTLIESMIREISDSMGYPVSIETDELKGASTSEALTFYGKSKAQLTSLCDSIGMQWSINHGVVEITKEGFKKLSEVSAPLLSYDTGLIEIHRQTQERKKKKEKEYEYKAFFNPRIVVNGIVSIDTPSASGVFINRSVKYDLGNFSGTNFHIIGQCHG